MGHRDDMNLGRVRNVKLARGEEIRITHLGTRTTNPVRSQLIRPFQAADTASHYVYDPQERQSQRQLRVGSVFLRPRTTASQQ